MRPQRMPARKNAQVLQDDRFKQRCHQFVGRRSDLLQTVDVGLRENAALARDFVQLDAVIFLLREFGCRNLQLGIDLVDNGACAARALVVHRRDLLLATSRVVVFEDDDLGVLPAKFDDRINLGMQLLDCERNRGDFLHELRANLIADRSAARARHEHARVMRVDADFGLHALQKFQRLLRLLGFVALIVLPQHLIAGSVNHDSFHGR